LAQSNRAVAVQIRNRRIRFETDIGQRGSFLIKGTGDFMPCGISVRMQDAIAAVRALAGENELRSLAIEFRAPLDQLLNRGRRFLHEQVDRLHVAEAVAGIDRILLMQFDAVIIIQCGRNSALRIFGRRFSQRVFCNHEHAARFRQLNRGPHAGHAGSDHEKIAVFRQTEV
jgi:hypothetical protein